jgi:hypothetical protein
MHQRELPLSPGQRVELERIRDRDRRAYLRERAAALLKIADGDSVRAVALHGLHRRRKPDTVYGWLAANQAGGPAALVQRPRGHRGFSPSAGRRAAARAASGA